MSQIKNNRPLIGTLYFGDIGYKTYDEFLIVSNKESTQVKETSIKTKSDVGIREYYVAIASQLAEELRVDEIPLEKVKEALENGQYLHRGEDRTELLKRITKKASSDFIDIYVSNIKTSVGEKGIDRLTGILLLGGGGAIFGDGVLQGLGFSSMVDAEEDLSMLNVKGCLLEALQS